VIEVKGDVQKSGQGLPHGGLPVAFDVQQQESPAAGPGELAAEGAGAAGRLIHGIDLGGADPGAERALDPPAFVQEAAEVGQVAPCGQDAQAFFHHAGHFRQFRFLPGNVLELLGDDVGGYPGETGEEQQQGILEFRQAVGGQGYGLDHDGVVGGKADAIQAAESGRHLVLRANAVAAALALDVDGLFRQLHFGTAFAAQGVEGVKQADRERGTGAETGHLGKITVVVDFDAVADAEFAQAFADGGVPDVLDALDVFDDGIDNPGFVFEEGREPAAGEIAVAGDGGGKHGPAVPAVPGGIIGAAAEKRDPVGRARNDHARVRMDGGWCEKWFINQLQLRIVGGGEVEMKQIWRMLGTMVWLGAAAGCGPHPAGEGVTVASLAERLADPLWLARLDQPDTRLHSSYDRTGGNNDYGTFLRDSSTPGWKVLADLKGPGYVSRVWFTGAKDGQPHRFRFFFDGEQTPRLAGDIKELFGGQFAPFLAPLAEYNNYCWYSFVPMPYSKNLRIECEQGPPEDSGAPRKVYYQVAESALPRGTPVETFAWPLPERDLAALEKARGVWQTNRLPPAGELRESDLAEGQERIRIAGPGVIRRLEFEPQWDRIPEESRDAILRDWLVAIRYDGSTNDSVKVPLGDLCGLPWRRVRTQSLYFGMTGNALFCAFPMPFAESVEIRLEAGKISPVPVKIRAWMAARPEASAGRLGYFHAGWWRTTPNDVGRPHPILRVKGRGKFVGCLLSVVTLDGSYWALEGDESIRKDKEKSPGWRGTGLEDYFNGGWYYQNVMAGPTHGLLVKEPFRTVQYRVHAMDPSRFDRSLDMAFERGPDHASRAYFESISWYYLDQPQAADTVRLQPENRGMPPDPRLDAAVVMTALWNHERMGDWQGARDELAARLRRHGMNYPPPARRMLEFRLAMLDEKLGGPDPLPRFLADADEAVRAAAQLLQRQRSDGAALAVMYANLPARLYLDGREVLQAGHPERSPAAVFDLAPGKHQLAIQAPRQRYPDWILAALRGRDWFVGTDPSWKFAFNPPGDWALPDYDDADWPELGGTGVKGPPEEPYIWVEPDPFLGMQSQAIGIRPTRDWPAQGGTIVLRKSFVVP